MAGVAQTHIYHGFACRRGTDGTGWRAWSWFSRPCRRGTVTPRHFAWQARHKLTSTVVLRGRRGTNSHLPSFCVAGVALMALGGALGLGLVARDAAALCVAGAAQTHIYRRLAWQAWHANSHLSSFCVAGVALMALGGALGLGLVARDAAALCVAGAAQTHIYRRFAWQAWQKITSIIVLPGRCGTDGTRGTLRGRRGTNSHLPSFCVAGVAQTHIYRRLAWQAWHANSHLSSFCVAGVALMALGGALGLRLVARDAAALCVAGVAQTHIYRRFAWQAWPKLTSTIVLRGRRGTDGTGWRAWSWFSRP